MSDRHIIFTGQIRNANNFKIELKKGLELVRQGFASKVHWASWRDQLEQIPETIQSLISRNDVNLVAVDLPEITGRYDTGILQYAQLFKALEGLDEADFVLKSRPDVVLPIERAREFLARMPTPEVNSWYAERWGFERRFLINWFDPSQFFICCDLAYAGQVRDMKRLSRVDAALEFVQVNQNALKHFGNAAIPVKFSDDLQIWWDWLQTYYPGVIMQRRARQAHGAAHSIYAYAASIAYERPDLHYDRLWQLSERGGASFGWGVYHRLAAELFELPVESAELRVTLAEREYWADSWSTVEDLSPTTSRGQQGCASHVYLKKLRESGMEALPAYLREHAPHLYAVMPEERRQLEVSLLRLAAIFPLGLIQVALGRIKQNWMTSLGL